MRIHWLGDSKWCTALLTQRPLPSTMTKHSKNNTASSVFSYAEYKKLDYGTKKVIHLEP
jgi:hypothetical protein